MKHIGKNLNSKTVSAELKRLYADTYVKSRKGIFEFILGGSTATKLLEVRVFDEATKICLCHSDSRSREKECFELSIMCNRTRFKQYENLEVFKKDADHVKARSKGGSTDGENCQMLFKKT